MTNGTAPTGVCPPGSRMTMRVYVVDRHGAIVGDRGTVDILGGDEPPPPTTSDPPCACPLHRVGPAVPR
ncbi:hypothetical protein ACL02U_10615 [Streptomyces sp. MS06]|uniref:hypothetical protein n=1 Tax=Streptomyces sp. MS06 TaxID=3385974 RepID=UPI0039A18F04